MKSYCKEKSGRRLIILSVIAVALLAAIVFCIIYVSDYYKADEEAAEAFISGEPTLFEFDGGLAVLPDGGARAGFIFYPGGKVEYTAYLPLMEALGEKGIVAVLLKMPFNLAVLDMNAADGVREKFPEVTKWYIGGHSLGGSMAASYIEKRGEEFLGLVLLGAYSTADLSQSGLSVLSVYGSEDGVMNRDKYEKHRDNLPENFSELVIDGGNHAYFGMYGEQEGDGTASISGVAQIMITAEAIDAFIEK